MEDVRICHFFLRFHTVSITRYFLFCFVFVFCSFCFIFYFLFSHICSTHFFFYLTFAFVLLFFVFSFICFLFINIMTFFHLCLLFVRLSICFTFFLFFFPSFFIPFSFLLLFLFCCYSIFIDILITFCRGAPFMTFNFSLGLPMKLKDFSTFSFENQQKCNGRCSTLSYLPHILHSFSYFLITWLLLSIFSLPCSSFRFPIFHVFFYLFFIDIMTLFFSSVFFVCEYIYLFVSRSFFLSFLPTFLLFSFFSCFN